MLGQLTGEDPGAGAELDNVLAGYQIQSTQQRLDRRYRVTGSPGKF